MGYYPADKYPDHVVFLAIKTVGRSSLSDEKTFYSEVPLYLRERLDEKVIRERIAHCADEVVEVYLKYYRDLASGRV